MCDTLIDWRLSEKTVWWTDDGCNTLLIRSQLPSTHSSAHSSDIWPNNDSQPTTSHGTRYNFNAGAAAGRYVSICQKSKSEWLNIDDRHSSSPSPDAIVCRSQMFRTLYKHKIRCARRRRRPYTKWLLFSYSFFSVNFIIAVRFSDDSMKTKMEWLRKNGLLLFSHTRCDYSL